MKKQKVYNGIDRPDEWKSVLEGKRIGLITNPSGVDREGRLTSDILFDEGLLTCLFSAEHGVRGDKQAGEKVDFYTDEKTGLPVYSLYGGVKHISPEILEGLDAVAFDIQDVGARFYTYIYTLSYAMEDCAACGKEMIVFDRLDPQGASEPQGSVLESEFASGVGRYPMATRFNMTVGEYARFINDTQGIGCRLTVIEVKGWSRDCSFTDTDLRWVAPSPNLPTPYATYCYIGTCIFEGTNVSEGRGTQNPFETVGAPWVDADGLVDFMRGRGLLGVEFEACEFIPTFSKHSGELCRGIRLYVTDDKKFRPFETGLYIYDFIRRNHKEFSVLSPNADGRYFLDKLLGCSDLRREDFDVQDFLARQKEKLEKYEKSIKPYYLYE